MWSHDQAAGLAKFAASLLVLAELLQVPSGWPAEPLHLLTLLFWKKNIKTNGETNMNWLPALTQIYDHMLMMTITEMFTALGKPSQI